MKKNVALLLCLCLFLSLPACFQRPHQSDGTDTTSRTPDTAEESDLDAVPEETVAEDIAEIPEFSEEAVAEDIPEIPEVTEEAVAEDTEN